MLVFHDLLFFVVCFDSNVYDYDNVVCVIKKRFSFEAWYAFLGLAVG
jgi:hypothetical protein